ncbi:copper amine oxidase N-terminal domain-containing protein [Desulfoscipio gibsoniae]|uniref:Copper amine oxidase family protein n=1 Tax=Desulfoscipio gibsoniae DSM 7213 TaxID=767817 RepID=R4KKD1_9FIRM|nr:copper amine oxidase N-terminal domain-containing protein [Desulfoscipio gibsoniae]AGL00081.1 copper amine oxidase family protein [Desulfoscipio gibsoniae DSM 7213]
MLRKSLFNVVLALVLCFTVVLAAEAAQPTAKDLVIDSIKNFDLGVDKGFYEKSQDETSIKITDFDGSLVKELGHVKGASIDLLSQLDASNNAIKISYTTDIKGNKHNGHIYLKDDKVILTKDFFSLLKELGFDAFKNNPSLLEQSNEYLYSSNEQLKSVWEQMISYQNQQLPGEYKELLLFLVEAIPDQYFNLSNNKVTLQLDQNGVEEFIYNLLAKVKGEQERVADIIVNLNKYNFEQMGISPEQMKQDIISGIDSMPAISREQIKLFGSFVKVNDFTYEVSLLPGGPKNFNMDLGFKAPDGSVEGQLTITVKSVGTKDNLEGSYNISGNFNALNGPQFDFSLACLYNYEAEIAYADTTVQAGAKDNTTGEVLLNFGATANSTTKVDTNLVVNAPALNAANSTDITSLIPGPQQEIIVTPPIVEEAELKVVVNGNTLKTDVTPSIKENKLIMVPARAVLEALGCEVKWIKPNEVQIIYGDKTILVIINETTYTANGLEKALSVPAYLEAGYTMIPVDLIIEELGAKTELVHGTVVITK